MILSASLLAASSVARSKVANSSDVQQSVNYLDK